MSKRKEKNDQLALLRTEEDFLPYYSDAFFERLQYMNHKILPWTVAILLYLGLIMSDTAGWDAFWKTVRLCLIMIAVCLLIGYESNTWKRFGYHFTSQGLSLQAWGKETLFLYSDITAAVEAGQVTMNTKELLVPAGKGRISFPYEIGNAKQQTHVCHCYQRLCENLPCQMPPMNRRRIGQLDKAYVYNRSFKKCLLALAVIEFFIFVMSGSFKGGASDFYVFPVVMCVLQNFSIYRMFQSVRLGEKNAEQLREKLGKEGKLKVKLRIHGMWEFLLVCALMLGCNFLIWRSI